MILEFTARAYFKFLLSLVNALPILSPDTALLGVIDNTQSPVFIALPPVCSALSCVFAVAVTVTGATEPSVATKDKVCSPKR